MTKGKMFALATMMAAVSDINPIYRNSKSPRKGDAVPSNVNPPLPNGTKEYFFNMYGEFSTESMLKTECVFKCVSINDKNAIKKFQNWKSKLADFFNGV